MTNPESQHPFIRCPIRLSSNSSGIYSENQDNAQIFDQLRGTRLPQAEQQSSATFSTYVCWLFQPSYT